MAELVMYEAASRQPAGARSAQIDLSCMAELTAAAGVATAPNGGTARSFTRRLCDAQ